MKIVVDSGILFAEEAFSELGTVVTVPGRQIKKDTIKDATVLLVRSITRVNAALLEGTSVKFVGSATIGTDHVDTRYLEDNSIGFANAPGSNAESVTEYIISALLQLSHEKNFDLKKKTLGIIGVGNIGTKVYRIARMLGMDCILNDPPKRRLTGSDIYRPLHEVFGNADIITIHVPLQRDGQDVTLNMVNGEFIENLKDGVILINTSRGNIVNEEQLCRKFSKFKGIIIDVWENEPSINLELLKLADITTAHIAGYSYDGKINGTDILYSAVCAFFFKDRKWTKNALINKIENILITLKNSPDIIYSAVQEAYPIMEDSKKLKEIFNYDSHKRSAFFDNLRTNYYKRLEFSHYTVKADGLKDNDKEVLKGLGFQVV